MRIISTHDGTDFDALASLVAAHKLFPDARMVLAANVSPPVREFLALHKDRFDIAHVSEVDLTQVTSWILVDVRRSVRLRAFGPLLERARRRDPTLHVCVFDHHGASVDDVPSTETHVERVGSATTLLVERIAAQGIALDPVEATLLALGIHVDTGSLAFAGTTSRDARALAWLLDYGVRLDVLNRYLHPRFSDDARALFKSLLGRAEVQRFGGEDVALLHAHGAGMREGLDIVASEIAALEGHRTLFVWTDSVRGHVQVIGRAREGAVDVGAVIATMGGGGHETAAAARVACEDAGMIRDLIVRAIKAAPPRDRRVADVMTTPAHTVSSHTPLQDLRTSLAVWHHTGAPVVDDGVLVGIIAASDLAHIDAHALRHPVASRMRRKVHTIAPDEPIEHALDMMVREDVGRLPVMRDGVVIGIVTRSDVRRALYGTP